MSRKEAPISQLENYLPPNTFDAVFHFLNEYKVHLTVARERRSILGDYRHRTHAQTHRISVNGNLNPYAFLITLLHELAHLLTFEKYGNRVQSHGTEWKQVFGHLLASFIKQEVFPGDIQHALLQSLHNPAASSCADDLLLRTLKKYDKNAGTMVFVEDMAQGILFSTRDGRVFRRGEQLRKRIRCEEVKTKKIYLFSPVYEARILDPSAG
jgi:SprT protein